MKQRHVQLNAGDQLFANGAAAGLIYTLYEGWAVRFRRWPGGARQILDFVLPGDIVGLPHGCADVGYSVLALTNAAFCELDASRLSTLFRTLPALAFSVFEGRLQEQRRMDTRLMMLGRLAAAERIGYLMLELRQRLLERGLMDGASCQFPLQRLELADAVGLSKVHVMRALRHLRQEKLAVIRGRKLTIPNVRKLAHFSGYAVDALAAKHPIL